MEENNVIIPQEDTTTENIIPINSTVEPDGNLKEFVNKENFDEFKLLSLKAKIEDIQSLMTSTTAQQRNLLTDGNDFDPIDEILKTVTEEDLKAMPPETLDSIFIDNEGKPITFNVDFTGNELVQFKRDFLIMRKQTLDSFDKFDKEIATIQEEIAQSQEEFDRLISEYGNVSVLIRRKLNERLEAAETDDQRKVVTILIESFDYAMTLDNIKKYCKSYKGKSILSDFLMEKQSQYIYRRYLKVNKSLDITTDLTSFPDLEKKYLPEEYQGRENIFVFSVIHFISSWLNKDYTKADGLFITQFAINLKNLYFDKFDSEDDKEIFISNIKEVIKIIG